MTDNLVEFQKKIKTTAYSRFHAARRLSRLNNSSLFALTALSFTLIYMTILQKYSLESVISQNLLDMVQLVSSVFILSLSLVVSFADYSSSEVRMYANAVSINGLDSDIDLAIKTGDADDEIKVRNEYKQLILQIDNHSRADYMFGRAERRNEGDENTTVDNKYWIEFLLPIIAYWLVSITALLGIVVMTYKYIKLC